MKVMSLLPDSFPERLFLFLARWSLVTAVLILVSIGFYSAVGSATSDKALGQEHAALLSAVRSPVLYRLAWASESLYWLLIGGTLIILAILFARRWPILAAFVAACGIGQFTSSLGALSTGNISYIAARYATAAPNQQAALLESYLNQHRVENAYYRLGGLLQCVGFLLSAWVAWRWIGFPRWASLLFAIGGLIGLVWFIRVVVDPTSALARPMVILDPIALFSVHVAMAVAFWRPSSAVVSGVIGASTAI